MTSSTERDELIEALNFADDDETFEPEAPAPVAAVEDPAPTPGPDDGITRWEYKAVLGGSGSKEATASLNAFGVEGWELVGVEPPQAGGQTVLYLKRPARA